jgi:tetratricopeptide (TPR) repeat protein
MKRIYLLLVISLVALAGGVGGVARVAGDSQSMTASRDLTEAEVRRTFDRVFRARVREQLAWTDSMAATCKGQPMYHLARARLYRELIPVDDESKEEVKRLAGPLYGELNQVIAQCTARIDGGDKDPNLRLYRGWAYMLASHVHTYEKSWWTAGRESKKGKEDLEWYLQRYPQDPVASSLMGAFLYFADTLPAAYKFVSKLLFLPSGDRDRGLQMMEMARGWNSIMESDNGLILYSVYLGFEGRFEEGLEGFTNLRREFPLHSTFIRPEAIMYPLLPRRPSSLGDSLDANMARVAMLPKDEIDWSTVTLIRFERAYADRFYNPARAIERFEDILRDDPKHPDWAPGFSAFELGRLKAAAGDAEGARRAWDLVLRDEHTKHLHDDVKAMRSALDKNPRGTGAGPRDVPAIYGESDDARARVRAELEAIQSPTVADMFYLGEVWLMSGNPDRALEAYTGAINPKTAPWDESYQMVAATRAGEILGAKGDYTAAMKHYERAGKFWRKEFLYDWVLEARRRYFERLKSGAETTPPSLLSATM